MALLIGAVGTFDLRMLGLPRGLALPALHCLVPFGVLGLALCAATDAMFVTTSLDQYLYNPAWQLKMLLLALAGANMALFYANTAHATLRLDPTIHPRRPPAPSPPSRSPAGCW